MYHLVKKVLSYFITRTLIIRLEPLLRLFWYQFYRGNKYQCNICKKSLRTFIFLKDGDKLCPYCGSIPRNRRLWDMLENQFLQPGIRILDFSPSRCQYRFLRIKQGITYISTDLYGEFPADHAYDIRSINLENNSFDLVICYHILEHVEDDLKAMRELYRVLKKGGVCLIQTPFKTGEIYEDNSIRSEEDRLKHFGLKDHVRIYTVESLSERLTESGFRVYIREFVQEENNTYGLNFPETILLCYK